MPVSAIHRAWFGSTRAEFDPRVDKLRQRHVPRGLDRLLGALAHEDRLVLPHYHDAGADGDGSQIHLHRGQRRYVPRRVHRSDRWRDEGSRTDRAGSARDELQEIVLGNLTGRPMAVHRGGV